jgi:hypothetical protein
MAVRLELSAPEAADRLAIPRVVRRLRSRTLEVIGVAEDVERSGHYQPLRPRL